MQTPHFLARRDSIARTNYGNVAGWLAGWLSVTAGIVSKRLKLFRPSGSPII